MKLEDTFQRGRLGHNDLHFQRWVLGVLFASLKRIYRLDTNEVVLMTD